MIDIPCVEIYFVIKFIKNMEKMATKSALSIFDEILIK